MRNEVKVTTSRAREDLADLTNRVSYGGERVLLTKHRKPIAALISIKDLELLEALENKLDIIAAEKAKDEPTSDFDEVCQRLGL